MGYGVTGLLGGMVSSTAVTLRLSQHARREIALARPLGVGVVGACTMLFPRVVLVSLVLNPDMALRLLPYLIPPFLAGAVLVAVPLWRSRAGREANAAGVTTMVTVGCDRASSLEALAVAAELKEARRLGKPHRLLPDKTLYMLFLDKSTRTRNAFETGMTQPGGAGELPRS